MERLSKDDEEWSILRVLFNRCIPLMKETGLCEKRPASITIKGTIIKKGLCFQFLLAGTIRRTSSMSKQYPLTQGWQKNVVCEWEEGEWVFMWPQ